jgi:hypothetical protein
MDHSRLNKAQSIGATQSLQYFIYHKMSSDNFHIQKKYHDILLLPKETAIFPDCILTQPKIPISKVFPILQLLDEPSDGVRGKSSLHTRPRDGRGVPKPA